MFFVSSFIIIIILKYCLPPLFLCVISFNLSRADSLAHQIRKKTRGNKRRWSLTESEAQRWTTLVAAARLNWLVRVEKNGVTGGQERKHSRKKQKVEVHTRKRARIPDERHGEEEAVRGRLRLDCI